MMILLPCSVILVLLSLHLHSTFAFSTPSLSLARWSLSSSLDTRDSTPAAAAASEDYNDDEKFKDAVLNVTNMYRKEHNATALRWNQTLADMAQKWSDGCTFEHSRSPTGENLSSGYPNTTASIKVWAQESTKYDYTKAQFSTQTGHFTQLVWKATESVGCGRSECNGEKGQKGKEAPGWYVVCEYWPRGNVIGEFGENVQDIGSKVPSGSGAEAKPSETAKVCPQGGICSAGVGGIKRMSLWGLGLVVGCGVWGVWS